MNAKKQAKQIKSGPFDIAIDAIRAVVDFSAAPDETVKSCRHAIAVLRAAGKVNISQDDRCYVVKGENYPELWKLMNAIKAAQEYKDAGKEAE